MTELTPATDAGPARGPGPATMGDQVDWPQRTAASAPTGDPAVDALLAHLETLPEQPVAAHGDIYAGLHDALAEALNEDVAGDSRP